MTMEQLGWALSLLVLAAWALLCWRLVRRVPELPTPRAPLARRILVVVVGFAALAASAWGPRVWSGTRADFPREALAEAPTREVVRGFRLPFLRQEILRAVDREGRVVRSERRSSLHVPVGLLLFLVAGFGLARRSPGKRRGGPPTVPLALALGVGVGGAGCTGAAESSPTLEHPERVFVEAAWDTLRHVRLSLQDTLLFTADGVTADSAGFWVLDRNARRVARFSWEAELLWAVGGEGAGPSEFGTLQAASVDAAGNLWVLDPSNGRITGLDPGGALFENVPLRGIGLVPHAFAVRPDGSGFYVMGLTDVLQPLLLHRDGTLEEGSPLRIEDRPGVTLLSLQGIIARDRGGEDWVWAFSMGDRMMRLRGLEVLGAAIPYAEEVRFPRMVESTQVSLGVTTTVRQLTERVTAAMDLEISDGEIRVRFGGGTEAAGRIIDRFALAGGAYLNTELLPTAGRFASWGDRWVIVANDPFPEVLVLRRR